MNASTRIVAFALLVGLASGAALGQGAMHGSVYRGILASNDIYNGVPGHPEHVSITHHGVFNAGVSESWINGGAYASQYSHFSYGHVIASGSADARFGAGGFPVFADSFLDMTMQLSGIGATNHFRATLNPGQGAGVITLTGPSGFLLDTAVHGDTLEWSGAMPDGTYRLYADVSAGLFGPGEIGRSFDINWTGIPTPGTIVLAFAAGLPMLLRRRRTA